MPSVREVLGDEAYASVVDRVQQSFPDVQSVVHEQHADALVLQVWNTHDDAGCREILGVPKPPQATIDAIAAKAPPAPPVDAFTYYVAHARHARYDHPTHAFTGYLPLVRVRLVAKTVNAVTIKTAIGDVIPQDHLFASVSQIGFKYGDDIGFQPERVDLITPARHGGARFGAIAVYLGYKNANDAEPSFYVLEAGLATGESRMAFLSPDMDVIPPRKKWYKPTPFTTEDSYYTGSLEMNGDEPDKLIVHALSPSLTPEVEVVVTYEKTAPKPIWPALITAEAAARIGSIGVKRGQLIFEDILAPIGDHLPWEIKPE